MIRNVAALNGVRFQGSVLFDDLMRVVNWYVFDLWDEEVMVTVRK